METNKKVNKKTDRLNAKSLIKINRENNSFQLLVIMILVFIGMSILSPDLFLSLDNLSSMAFQFPEYGILAFAMMLAMLTDGIDLSIVGISNLAGILASLIMVNMMPDNPTLFHAILVIVLAIIVAILTGVVCGYINGTVISKIGIPPILATLASMQLFTGIAIIITKGTAIFGLPNYFLEIGNGSIGFVPIPLILFILFAVLISIVLNKTSFGLKLYMMGTNSKASKFSGINNSRMLIKTYILSGVLAAFVGLIIISRTNSAKADYGTSYTLQAILISVLGGVNPSGGFGTIGGVVMAILTLQFLSSGFNILRFSNYFKDFAWGAVLILVIVLNYFIEQKRMKKGSK